MSTPEVHYCETCRANGVERYAGFGFRDHWYCAEHQSKFTVKPTPPKPEVIMPDDIAQMPLSAVRAALSTETDVDRRAASWRRIDDDAHLGHLDQLDKLETVEVVELVIGDADFRDAGGDDAEDWLDRVIGANPGDDHVIEVPMGRVARWR